MTVNDLKAGLVLPMVAFAPPTGAPPSAPSRPRPRTGEELARELNERERLRRAERERRDRESSREIEELCRQARELAERRRVRPAAAPAARAIYDRLNSRTSAHAFNALETYGVRRWPGGAR